MVHAAAIPAVASTPVVITREEASTLQGWTVLNDGGSAPQAGTITATPGGIVLVEGNSFDVGVERAITIPAHPSTLTFNYDDLNFETTDNSHIRDAFEVGLVDANDQPLVPTIAADRNVFLNTTAGLAPATGSATTTTTTNGVTTVTTDISNVAPGPARLAIRLINNSQDTQSTVRIPGLVLATPTVGVDLAYDTAPLGSTVAAYLHDRLTTDPTVTGTAADLVGIATLTGKVGAGPAQDITANLVDGAFRWTPTALQPGLQHVVITATGSDGQAEVATTDFTLDGAPQPVAADVTIPEGGTAKLDASASVPSLAAIVSQGWTFADGTTASGAVTTRSYAKFGTDTATLNLVDSAGATASKAVTVTVTNLAPVVAPLAPAVAPFGTAYKLLTTFTDAGVRDTHVATIDWGDGTPRTEVAVTEAGGAGSVAASHYYAGPGTFTPRVEVTDDGGLVGSAMGSVVVAVTPPTSSDLNPPPYVVPGTVGTNTTVVFTLKAHRAAYRNAGGVYTVADQSGRVAGLLPGQAGYARVAMTEAGRYLLFPQRSKIGTTVTLALPAGTLLAPFLVENASMRAALSRNPADHARLSPHVFFEFAAANPDGFRHDRLTTASSGVTTIGTEDEMRGFDRDYNDQVMTVTVVGASPTATPIVVSTGAATAGPTKFYVADGSTSSLFRYDAAGQAGAVTRSALDGVPASVASDPTGSRTWTIDAAGQIAVARADGTPLGSWQASGIRHAVGIAVVGNDIWILDGATHRVERFVAAVGRTAGGQAAQGGFALAAADGSATGLVGDGANFWVSDASARGGRVFVYSRSGQTLGSWATGATDPEPVGITLDPSGGTDLWTVDGSTRTIDRFAGGLGRRSGTQSFTNSTPLAAGNTDPVGIADPPPAPAVQLPTPYATGSGATGATILVTAHADGLNPATGGSATVNGQPADALDASGNLFARVTVGAGPQTVAVAAADPSGTSPVTTIRFVGTPAPSGPIDFTQLADVTPSYGVQYGRTSFDRSSQTLYADMSARNVGTFAIGTPLLVEVHNISNPQVRPVQAAGYAPDGTPYFDYSRLVAGGISHPGDTTGVGTLAFIDPDRTPFTYSLTFLGELDHPPSFTSVPVVSTPAGRSYEYDASATDPDSDPLNYTLIAGPLGMSVAAATGAVTWAPTSADAGNHAVVVQVDDGRGRSAQQSYTLTVADDPNHPPSFTTNPVVDAVVGVAYAYPSHAADPDLDPVHYSLVSGPADLAVDPTTGAVSWTPVGTQLGLNSVEIEADDGRGGTATQSYQILVQTPKGYHPPLIVSTPEVNYRSPAGAQGSTATLQMTIRDFQADYSNFEGGITGVVPGIVASLLGGDGTPVYVGPPGAGSITGAAAFQTFYHDVPGLNEDTTYPLELHETTPTSGIYAFDDPEFFPIDNRLFGNQGNDHNFHFTTETHAHFTYRGGETLNFAGDDDVWVFLNGHLAIDLGGVHATANAVVNLDDVASQFGMTVGGNYSFDLFYNERHTEGSDLALSTDLVLQGGHPYEYDVRAIDPQSSPIRYTLDHGPDGVAVDPRTGVLTWTPAAGLTGDYPVTVRATDDLGGFDTQSYTLHVLPAQDENPPRFTTTPATRVNQGTTYTYNAHASDPDGDPVTYRLVTGPAGMQLNPDTGVVTWRPTHADLNTNPLVTITAADGRGGIDAQNFHVAAVRLTNTPPTFTSTAGTVAASRLLYRYQAVATDADGDRLTYDLPVHPAGMVVDPTTGLVEWVPNADQGGTQDVLLRVSDGQGGVDLQSYQVVVNAYDSAPVVTSVPTGTPEVGVPFAYQVRAQDAEADALTYALLNPPTGMTINPASGLLTWTATAAGEVTPTVVVNDGRGGTASQALDLVAVAAAADRAPQITSSPRPAAQFAAPYLYQVAAGDPDGDPLTFHLDSTVAGVVLDPATGLLRWTPSASQVGATSFVVRVTDGRSLADGTPGQAVQTFVVTVADGVANHPPVTTTTPTTVAVVGRTYAYDAAATDPDGDPLTWTLAAGAPPGLSLDARGGTLRWNPTADQVGSHPVTLTARDPLGGTATQTFTIQVRGVDSPPNILSTPPTYAGLATPYSYAVRAVDPDGDPLRYRLAGSPPAGLTIDPASGRITWASPGPAGSYPVRVIADDGLGGIGEQDYTLIVAAPMDHPPSITSPPMLTGAAGAIYSYQIAAIDPDGDPLTFAAPTAPAWLTVDPVTGLLAGIAPAASGTYSLTVEANDGRGGRAEQSYNLTTRQDHPPTITSAAITTATAGAAYLYEVVASDPDGDPLRYAITSAPTTAGLAIDAQGRVTWSPSAAAIGTTRHVVVTATDPFGGSATQAYDLTAGADTTAPTVRVVVAAAQASRGADVAVLVSASDDVGVAAVALTVDSQPLHVDAHGGAVFHAASAGVFTLVATATDAAGNSSQASATIRVIDPDARAPIVAIRTPTDDTQGMTPSITAPTPVIGSVAAPDGDLIGYTLAVAPVGSGTFTTIAQVSRTTPLTDAPLGTFDPTMLPNGSYVLRLTADTAGGQESSVDQDVSVAGNLKLGDFKLQYTDLSIPVAGIPVSILRSYDSLDAASSADFGYGWHLSLGDVQLKVSEPDDAFAGSGMYPAFVEGTRVTLTRPGGVVEGYTFEPQPEGFFGVVVDYHPAFVPDLGDQDSLTAPDATLTKLDDGTFVNLDADLTPYNPADPVFGGTYTLTSADRLVDVIDGNTGTLITSTDRHGNALTFSPEGITSNRGVEVAFQRDFAGRITQVTDPRGNSIHYRYDGLGNLVATINRMGGQILYNYRADHPHFIDTVTDRAGDVVTRPTYDASGRVSAVADANGNVVPINYDLTNRVQSSVDPATGGTASVVLDALGRTGDQVDQLGNQTISVYHGAELYQTIVRSAHSTTPDQVTTMGYDSRGRLTSTTDALGDVSRMTYDSSGNLVAMSDPLGATTTRTYDPTTGDLIAQQVSGMVPETFRYDPQNGDLLSQTQNGETSTFEYDAFGQQTAHVSPAGARDTMAYDANGNKISDTSIWVDPADPKHRIARTSVYAYDAEDRLSSTTDPNGQVTSQTYGALNRMVSQTDANGTATATYDPEGLQVQNQSPDGQISRTVFDADGRAAYVEDPHAPGTSTTGAHYLYDADGRVIRTEYVSGLQVGLVVTGGATRSVLVSPGTVASAQASGYNAQNQPTLTTDGAGQVTTDTYDVLGRQTSETTVLGTTHTTYDAVGHAISTEDAEGRRTYTSYDLDGRPVATGDDDGGTTTSTYDDRGNLTSRTDAVGATTNYEYDALNQLVAVVGPPVLDPATNQMARPRTKYTYDAYGNTTSIRDPLGHVTTSAYNPDGTLAAQTGPDGSRKTYSYDGDGNVASQTDANGTRTNFTYFDDGTVHTKTLYAKGSTTADSTVTYAEDAMGNRTDVARSDGLKTHTDYNDDGTIADVTSPAGTISYGYDPSNGRLVRTTTSQSEQTYSYNAQGLLSTVTVDRRDGQPLAHPETTHYTYNEAGDIVRVDHPDGTATVNGFDDAGHLSSAVDRAADGTEIRGYAYTDRPDGKIAEIKETAAGALVDTIDYIYDALGRLTHEALTATNSGDDYAADYAYDLAGNRVSEKTTGALGYGQNTTTYNDRDQPIQTTSEGGRTEFSATTYAYDPDGNLLSADAGNGNALTVDRYDLEGHLIGATVRTPSASYGQAASTVAATYQVDDDGNRIAEATTTTSGQGTPTSDDRHFLVDANNPTDLAQVLEEHAADGKLVASYNYGLTALSQSRAGVVSYDHTDGQGNVRATTNAHGATTSTDRYTAFGVLVASTGAVANPHLYRAQYFDAASDLYDLRARQYDPATGRFTTTDPYSATLSNPISLNRYLYSDGDGVNQADLTGQCSLSSLGVSTSLGSSLQAFSASFIGRTIIGAGFGAAINAGDAFFHDKDPVQAAIFGFVVGATFGAGIGGAAGLVVTPALRTVLWYSFVAAEGIGLGAGITEDIYDGNYGGAAYRASVGFLSFFFLLAGRPTAEPGCFAAGTEVVLGDGRLAPIEKIGLGRRVATRPGDDYVPAGVEPDPATWRAIRFRGQRADGFEVHVSLLRSLDWIDRSGVVPGRLISLELEEIGVTGYAMVLAVDPCPAIATGPGRVVTGTFSQVAREGLVHLSVNGLDEPIVGTANHPFWSADRFAFVPVGELQQGERIGRLDGRTARVLGVAEATGPRSVHTLEVQGDHVFHITHLGLLVHNFCQNKLGERPYTEAQTALIDGLTQVRRMNKNPDANVAAARYEIDGVPQKEFLTGVNSKTPQGDQIHAEVDILNKIQAMRAKNPNQTIRIKDMMSERSACSRIGRSSPKTGCQYQLSEEQKRHGSFDFYYITENGGKGDIPASKVLTEFWTFNMGLW